MAETKVCGACGKEKPVDKFYFKIRAKNLRQSKCIPCQLEYQREHYEKNRHIYIARAAEQKKGLRPHQRIRISSRADNHYPTVLPDDTLPSSAEGESNDGKL